MVIGNPFPLKQNSGKSFQGSIVLGKGFVLSQEEAEALIARNPRNKEVLFPYLNGDDLNNDPEQKPSRWVINFFDWDEEKARSYPDCFEIVERLVKPERQRWEKDKNGNDIVGTYALRKPLPQKWWIYGEKRPALYNTISQLDQVMVSCRVSKYINQSLVHPSCVFDVTTNVVSRNSHFAYAILQSSLHIEWAWKYASTMKGDIRYVNGNCIDTFPFPQDIPVSLVNQLESIGKKFHGQRSDLMNYMNLGLTKSYNIFHSRELTSEIIKKYCKKDSVDLSKIQADIIELRDLYVQMNETLLKAYKWDDLNVRYGFYEVDYLPENDRLRFTIDPQARKEILKRLLKLNHDIYAAELEPISKQTKRESKKKNDNTSLTLFS